MWRCGKDWLVDTVRMWRVTVVEGCLVSVQVMNTHFEHKRIHKFTWSCPEEAYSLSLITS